MRTAHLVRGGAAQLHATCARWPTPLRTHPAPCPGGESKLYATVLPADDPTKLAPGSTPRGVSILARDLQVGARLLQLVPGICCLLAGLASWPALRPAGGYSGMPPAPQPCTGLVLPTCQLPLTCPASSCTLQTVTFYDSRGEFVGVRRLGSGKAIEVEGMTIRPQVSCRRRDGGSALLHFLRILVSAGQMMEGPARR